MRTHPVNLLDASWLFVESPTTPMHVGGLMLFSPPPDAGPGFLRDMVNELRSARNVAPPWNMSLATPRLKAVGHRWVEREEIDLEYHVRRSALPWPGGERELGQLIARLHSHPLDFTKPPWECHYIEGLQSGRFALYIKMHHSLIDGISGMKLLQRTMSTDPKESLSLPPFWTVGAPGLMKDGEEAPHAPLSTSALAAETMTALQAVVAQARLLPDVARAFGDLVRAYGHAREGLIAPFDAPASILNRRVGSQRRVATQQFELDRLKAVAAATDATLNDVVLALCGTALRRLLIEEHALPDAPLTAGMPVSFRAEDDEGVGTAISFAISTLGTDIEDPLARLHAIVESTRRAKQHVRSIPAGAMTQYTMVLMAPTILTLVAGMAGRVRPMFNVTISNVPGPRRPLYFRGARMEATYPISIVTHGQALNITCHSYAGTLEFGFTGCRDSVPGMQRLAVFAGEALEELERALAKGKARARKPAPARPKARRRAGASAAPVSRSAPPGSRSSAKTRASSPR